MSCLQGDCQLAGCSRGLCNIRVRWRACRAGCNRSRLAGQPNKTDALDGPQEAAATACMPRKKAEHKDTVSSSNRPAGQTRNKDTATLQNLCSIGTSPKPTDYIRSQHLYLSRLPLLCAPPPKPPPAHKHHQQLRSPAYPALAAACHRPFSCLAAARPPSTGNPAHAHAPACPHLLLTVSWRKTNTAFRLGKGGWWGASRWPAPHIRAPHISGSLEYMSVSTSWKAACACGRLSLKVGVSSPFSTLNWSGCRCTAATCGGGGGWVFTF